MYYGFQEGMSEYTAWAERNKAQWTRVYDEVITPDLEREWKRREELHQSELKRKEEHQQILSGHINNEIIKNAYLTEENARLNRQLERQRQGSALPDDHQETSKTGAMVSAEDYRHLADTINDLNKNYQDAIQKTKYLERKNNAVMQKNKEMKESVRAWQEYCDRHLGKQKPKSELKPRNDQPKPLISEEEEYDRLFTPSSPASSAARTPRPLTGFAQALPALATFAHPDDLLEKDSAHNEQSKPRDTLPKEEAKESIRRNEAETLEIADERSTRLSQADLTENIGLGLVHGVSSLSEFGVDKLDSSQTTQDETQIVTRESATNAAGDDDDVPQVVHERSLKRKRRGSISNQFEVYTDRISSDGTPTRPFKVKEEQCSSPPLPATTHLLTRNETIDLDELGPNLISTTPRRRQTLRRTESIHSNKTGQLLRHPRSNSAPFVKDESQDGEPSMHLDEPPYEGTHDAHEVAKRNLGESCGSFTSDPGTVLRPLDLNVIASVNEESPKKRKQRAEIRNKQKYELMAESGDTPPPTDKNRRKLPPSLAREQINRRLQAKYNNTPARNISQTPKSAPAKANQAQLATSPDTGSQYTPLAGKRSRKTLPFEPQSEPRQPSTADARPVWHFGAKPTRPVEASSTFKEHVAPPSPLRTKDVSSLNLTDFKANPAYNQGYSYAFNETIRKRSDRACLPGCTNAQCCGSTFRALAEALPPLPRSQEEELLEDYLGDAYDSMDLTLMSVNEREELILQARTRKLAGEHGKHRQAYDGRRTPPGFWRIDFPSTQEEREDREKAVEMERQMVRERWLEAQRKGGRWVFRDE